MAKYIIKEEGYLAVYRGLAMTVLREGIYSTLRLGLYEPYKKLLGAKDRLNTPI